MMQSIRRGVRAVRGLRRPRPGGERRGAGPGVWPDGARAALSITFDDARASQPRVAFPLLARLDVRTTFFVLPDPLRHDRVAWQEAVAAGHEIGNHTVNHPCSANFPWSRDRALESLTVDDLAAEVADAEHRIEDAVGVTPSVFAYPCGQTFVGRGRETQSLVPFVADRFLAGRTFNDVVANAPAHCDLAQVAARDVDHLEFAQVLPYLEAAVADRAWLVVGGHEVSHGLAAESTQVATIEAIVGWCREHDVWIDTVGAVAARVQDLRRAT
jgi:peptidoglycan/xylan/chitin deacetylase (PgdA/CDA1 family)